MLCKEINVARRNYSGSTTISSKRNKNIAQNTILRKHSIYSFVEYNFERAFFVYVAIARAYCKEYNF